MKKVLLSMLALCLIASFAFAQDEKADVITIKGTIVDNMCATANIETLDEFVKTHPKSCAIMPACAGSGYSILANDNMLYKFDAESDKKVETFLKKTDSKLQVVIEAKMAGDELSLVSIKNQ